MSSCHWTYDDDDHDTQRLQPNSDIAGLGIIVAFVVSAWFSVLLTACAYIFGWIPSTLLNNFDVLLLKRTGDRSEKWTRIVQSSILALSDQQMVTGIGILTAGFIQFDTISTYHWNTVTYLAWMASNVHLTSLTYLRPYLLQRRVIRGFRLLGMTALFFLLCGALYPSTNNSWLCIIHGARDGAPSGLAIPAKCLWYRQVQVSGSADGLTFCSTNPSDVRAAGVVSYVILAFSYAWKSLTLFRSIQSYLHAFGRTKVMGLLERVARRMAARRPSFLSRVLRSLVWSVYISVLMMRELAGSFAISLLLIVGGLCWGTAQLMVLRPDLPASTAEAENDWTFGQILPMLLLILPLLTMSEQYYDEMKTSDSYSLLAERPHPSIELVNAVQVMGDFNSSAPAFAQQTTKISELFEQLDINNESTYQRFHVAIYKSIAFRCILLLWLFGSIVLAVCLLTLGSFDGFTNFVAISGVGLVCVLSVAEPLFLALVVAPWSRLYQ